ncbi:relaxin receptor 1-like [Anneissia japonica]|uniref:relaxin receptor 1-like n=1 Tax=Anneissia japonica TaxID=1529436 RepID=UPI001425AEDC|nr:relaxin receptor 1-like [Anneissia japonica]
MCSSKLAGLICIFVLLPFTYCCQSGTFPCGDDKEQCFPQEFQCNDVVDCTNAADEQDCEEKAGFGDDFDRRHNTTIVLKYDVGNYNTNVCLIPVYPPVCKCGNKTEVDCSATGMTTIPQAISRNISRLTLLGNDIQTILNNSFVNFEQLHKLTLAQNGLVRMEINAFNGLTELKQLYLSENNIKEIPSGVFLPLKRLEWLVLDYNELTTLLGNPFKGLLSLYWLSVRHNKINDANIRTVLENLPSLAWLELDHNKITRIEAEDFARDTPMSTLSLKNNEVSYVHPLAFTSLINLLDLDLCGNKISELSPMQFKNLTKLDRLYFSSFQYCSYAPHVRNCNPKTDGISSIYNLLESTVLRVSVWTIATMTFIGNFGVFISRLLMKAEHRVYSLFIMNLCAADFLMSIYLFTIAAQDYRFRDVYNQNARQWVESTGCKMSGFLAMVSSEVSVLLLALISVERFLCIVFPYEFHRLKVKEAAVIISSIWAVGILIAWIPLLAEGYFGNFYGTNGVCFPLHIHGPRIKGWEYSVAIFLGMNLLALILIIVSYIGMFISIRTTRKAAVQIGYKGDMTYARRFFFIVLTDSLCWIPIIILKVISLCNIPIGDNLYAWIVIFVLPLNSALNPILYTLSTTTFSQWFLKLLKIHKQVSHNYVTYSPQRTARRKSGIAEENGSTDGMMSYANRPSLQTNCSDLLSTAISEDAAEDVRNNTQYKAQHSDNEQPASTYFVTCV